MHTSGDLADADSIAPKFSLVNSSFALFMAFSSSDASAASLLFIVFEFFTKVIFESVRPLCKEDATIIYDNFQI